jgi:hypothetical protein
MESAPGIERRNRYADSRVIPPTRRGKAGVPLSEAKSSVHGEASDSPPQTTTALEQWCNKTKDGVNAVSPNYLAADRPRTMVFLLHRFLPAKPRPQAVGSGVDIGP